MLCGIVELGEKDDMEAAAEIVAFRSESARHACCAARSLPLVPRGKPRFAQGLASRTRTPRCSRSGADGSRASSKPRPGNGRDANQTTPSLEVFTMTRNTTLERKQKPLITDPVFAGIDYSKAFSFVTIGDKDGKVLQQFKVMNNEDEWNDFFARFSKLKCALESCRGYEWLLDELIRQGHEVRLAEPRSVKLIAQSRCKTDKIDSRVLMELLAKDFLPVCYQPTKKERKYREILRSRAKLVNAMVRFKQRVHALLDKENKGLQYPFSAKGRKELDERNLDEPRDEIMKDHLELIDFLEAQIHKHDVWIRQLAKSNADVYRLKQMPGFDVLTAMVFVAEVGNIHRFRNAAQVAAFLGLVPRVYSSGETNRHGRITKTGSKLLRRMLVESAWSAIRKSPALRTDYNNIARKRGKKVAIIAIARKLAEIGYHILKEKKGFDESKLDAGLARASS